MAIVSNTTKKKLPRISELDEKSDTYTMSAYLVAQLGKNYTNGRNKKITGKELVELAWTVIGDAQYMLGGMVTFHNLTATERRMESIIYSPCAFFLIYGSKKCIFYCVEIPSCKYSGRFFCAKLAYKTKRERK